MAIADAAAAGWDEEIHVEAVPTKYPQGAEKMLIMALLGAELPAGGLPSALGLVGRRAGTPDTMPPNCCSTPLTSSAGSPAPTTTCVALSATE